jgi:hypothetical protein
MRGASSALRSRLWGDSLILVAIEHDAVTGQRGRPTSQRHLASGRGILAVGGSAGRDEAALIRVDDDLDSVADAKFLQDAGDVCLSGCVGDDQAVADLGVGQPCD